jgi:hypothetical protein
MKYQWFTHLERSFKKRYGVNKYEESDIISLANSMHGYSQSVGDLVGVEFARSYLRYKDEWKYLAIDRETLQHIEATRLSRVEGSALHFPHKHYCLGIPKNIDPMLRGVVFHWIDGAEWANEIKVNPDFLDEKQLVVYADCTNENGTPFVLREAITERNINDMISDDFMGKNISIEAWPVDDHEKQLMLRLCKLIIKLGLIMSIEEAKLLPVVQKDLPKKVKTGQRLQLNLTSESKGRSGHFVSGHIRQLRDPKYYNGNWESYPIGTRYSYVSTHIRGKK